MDVIVHVKLAHAIRAVVLNNLTTPSAILTPILPTIATDAIVDVKLAHVIRIVVISFHASPQIRK
jgi:hypothetical protein